MLNRKQPLTNAKTLLQDDIAVILGACSFGGLLYLWLTYTDIAQMSWNLGKVITYTQIVAHALLAILFGIFITATIYKIRWMKNPHTTTTWSWLLGGFLSTIVIGCPACSIGLASYLGLWWILINLPWFGLEVKLVWLALLSRATWTTLKDLYTCKIHK